MYISFKDDIFYKAYSFNKTIHIHILLLMYHWHFKGNELITTYSFFFLLNHFGFFFNWGEIHITQDELFYSGLFSDMWYIQCYTQTPCLSSFKTFSLLQNNIQDLLSSLHWDFLHFKLRQLSLIICKKWWIPICLNKLLFCCCCLLFLSRIQYRDIPGNKELWLLKVVTVVNP